MLRSKHILKCVLATALCLAFSTTYAVRPASAQTPLSVSLVAKSPFVSSLTTSQTFFSLSHPIIVPKIKKQPKPEVKKIVATVIAKPADYVASITPTATPEPTNIPTPQVNTTTAANPGGLNPDVLFGLVNAHRQGMGLAAFEKNDATCNEANTRAGAVGEEIEDGHMHSGFWGNPHPGVSTENIISMNSEQAAFNWWVNDYIHRIAIEGNYLYSCVACSGNSCTEEFGN